MIVVRVGVDPALTPVPAEQIDSVVGKRAALDVASGSLLTTAAVTDKALPGAGSRSWVSLWARVGCRARR